VTARSALAANTVVSAATSTSGLGGRAGPWRSEGAVIEPLRWSNSRIGWTPQARVPYLGVRHEAAGWLRLTNLVAIGCKVGMWSVTRQVGSGHEDSDVR